MAFCLKCGSEISEGARYCPACGTQIPASSGGEDPYLGRDLDNKFRIERLLGIGGMGRVYQATQLSLDKTICVKVLRSSMMMDETLVGRFHREARAASRLNHPNSISVIDFGQAKEDGSLYLAMEFVPGIDFGKLIRDAWPLGEERIIHVMDQVLSALADAHAAGIIHRDLKPENIMVSDLRGTKDFVKVLDFGIAKIQEGSGKEVGLTQMGMVCGTPEYMSPEQARGEDLDARSDIYAVGVILYQAVAKRLPFMAPTAMGIVTKHLTEPPPTLGKIQGVQVSPGLDAVIMKALSKDREGRQATALALQQELNAIRSQKIAYAQQGPLGQVLFTEDQMVKAKNPKIPTVARMDPQSGKEPSKRPSNWWTLIIAVLLVILICGGLGYYFLVYQPGQRSVTTGKETQVQTEGRAGLADGGGVPTEKPDAGAASPVESVEISDSAKLYYNAGKELMAQNKLEQAIDKFQKAAKESPNFAAVYKAMGNCYMQLGDQDAAKKNFRAYLEKDSKAPDRQVIEELIQSL